MPGATDEAEEVARQVFKLSLLGDSESHELGLAAKDRRKTLNIKVYSTMLRDRDYQAGREIDTLIHKAVFGRDDEPLPYSTNVDAADLLVKRFDLQVMPVFELTPSLAPDHLERDLETGRYKQEPLEYSVISLEDENGEKVVRSFSSAPTPTLAVCRTVLVLTGNAETSWVSFDL